MKLVSLISAKSRIHEQLVVNRAADRDPCTSHLIMKFEIEGLAGKNTLALPMLCWRFGGADGNMLANLPPSHIKQYLTLNDFIMAEERRRCF